MTLPALVAGETGNERRHRHKLILGESLHPIADLGNIIRHAYDEVDLGILWDISEKHLSELEYAVDALLKGHAIDGDAL